MRLKHLISPVFGLISLATAFSASAVIINFETTPSILTGPSLFSAAGPAQDITVGGITVSGGVVLGFPTNFPAAPFGTAPNVYGTANHPAGGAVGDSSLLSTISINIDPGLSITTVEGLLFNGLIGQDTYNITAFSSSVAVDTVSFVDLPANLSSGFGVFRLNSGGAAIDLVTISTDLGGVFSGEWDFIIDTLAIGEPIENSVVPVPPALYLFGSGILGLVGIAKRRKSGYRGTGETA